MVQISDINFRNLVYELNEGIYICDLSGTFIYANQTLAAIFGLKNPSEIIGKKIEEFLTPGDARKFRNKFQNPTAPGRNETTITSEIIRGDHTIAQIEIRPMPFIKNRKIMGNQGVVRDITAQRQVENNKMYEVNYDSLTGIFNSTFFNAELKRLEKGRQFPISIIILKMGGVQNANENEFVDLEERDKIIKSVARKLFHSFRGDEIVARIRNDEFGVLLPNVDENSVNGIITRLRVNLHKIIKNKDETDFQIYIGASTEKKGGTLSSVLDHAEDIAQLAMKKNKHI